MTAGVFHRGTALPSTSVQFHAACRSHHPSTDVGVGLFAEVRKHPHSLVISSTLADGTRHGPVTIPMRKKDLLEAARTGEFFSYVAGVA